jgi:hypothetical protein
VRHDGAGCGGCGRGGVGDVGTRASSVASRGGLRLLSLAVPHGACEGEASVEVRMQWPAARAGLVMVLAVGAPAADCSASAVRARWDMVAYRGALASGWW